MTLVIMTVGLSIATAVQATSYVGVDVRLETSGSTLLDTTVYIPDTGCTITDASSVEHVLDSANAACAFAAAADSAGLEYEFVDYGFGLYLNAIDEFAGDSESYWLYYVNIESAAVGMADYLLEDGDELLMTYGSYESPFRLTLDQSQVTTKSEVTATVESYSYDYVSGSGAFVPESGVVVYFGDSQAMTDESGKAKFTPNEQGAYIVQAESYQYRRSNVETLRVYIRMTGSFQTLSKYRRRSIRTSGASYLKEVMDENGLVDSNKTLTEWSAMALVAAGKSNKEMFAAVKSNHASINQDGVAGVARHILALSAIGKNPKKLKGVNHIKRLKRGYTDNQFGDASLCNDDIFAGLALTSAGVPWDSLYLHDALTASLLCQNDDGGFGYSQTASSDVDTTAAWLMLAYKVKGRDVGINISDERSAALAYLTGSQNPDGGWGYAADEISNTDSTAWALMALRARGHEAKSVTTNNLNGFHFLGETAKSDGNFSYDTHGTASLESLNTAYAVMALYGKPFPVNKTVKFRKRGK